MADNQDFHVMAARRLGGLYVVCTGDMNIGTGLVNHAQRAMGVAFDKKLSPIVAVASNAGAVMFLDKDGSMREVTTIPSRAEE